MNTRISKLYKLMYSFMIHVAVLKSTFECSHHKCNLCIVICYNYGFCCNYTMVQQVHVYVPLYPTTVTDLQACITTVIASINTYATYGLARIALQNMLCKKKECILNIFEAYTQNFIIPLHVYIFWINTNITVRIVKLWNTGIYWLTLCVFIQVSLL